MRINSFDQFGKKLGLHALEPSGRTSVQHEIHTHARHADLRHEPDPARERERSRLGLLGRLASHPCLIELFSSTPGEDKILQCVAKLLSFRQNLQREAMRRRRSEPGPAPPLLKPHLWFITAGRPSLGIDMLGALPDDAWPRGVYLTPAPKGRRRRPGTRGVPGGMQVGFIVASELPRERETILVRLMAGGAALPAAIADLAELPRGAYERLVASANVIELRRMLGQKSRKSKQEEAFIVNTVDAFELLKEEGRREGRDEGRRQGRDEGLTEANARAVLTVLRVRGVAVPNAAREQILTEKDPARLERWIERAILATSIADLLGEPS